MGGTYLLSKQKIERPEQTEIMEIQKKNVRMLMKPQSTATQKGNVFTLENVIYVIDCTPYNSVKRLLNVTCYVL